MTGFRSALLALLLLRPGLGYAVAVDPPLDDPVLEARAQEVFKTLRCLVCQNQSISDSDADLARDLREIVRERVAAGDSDDEARAFLVDRYGDWVLLKPPVKGTTLALWVGPLVLFCVALVIAVGFYRRPTRSGKEALAPLDENERQRMNDLMNDREDG